MTAARRRSRRDRSAVARGVAISGGKEAWRQWELPYRHIEILSDDQVEAIHEASLTVLSEIGIRVLSGAARTVLAAGGAEVSSDMMVRFDPALVMEAIGHAPSAITIRSRNAACDGVMGGNRLCMATVGGSPFYSDIDTGRRDGTLSDFENFCKLAQTFNVVHMIGPNVEPQDIPLNVRHLTTSRAQVVLTEKAPFLFFRGHEAVTDGYEIFRLAHGLSEDEFRNTPVCWSVANSNSPLQLDELMCRGIIDAAEYGQVMVLTPFTLSGAMAPVTLAGALTQQNAEALAGIALSQMVRPGAPVIYGSFTSNVDMRSGSPAFGTPEYTKAAFASGQLARRYGLPLRSSAPTASNCVDAQAAYETQMSLWGAVMGGANMVLHAAGWLEGGLVASAEKFIVDVEMLQMFAELLQPIAVDEASIGLDAIRDVGPGGHFFGTQHTIERFEDAFYSPLVSDWRNFETWRDSGSVDATHRANKIFKDVIAGFEPPPLDQAILDEIDAFIVRRTEQGGADIDR